MSRLVTNGSRQPASQRASRDAAGKLARMASRGGAFALTVVLCSVLALALQGGAAAAKRPLVPAMFVFGDSLVDVGNNNHLDGCNVLCKANYPRYGMDLPCHSPTGRFSNGYNLADRLAQRLGFAESPPPFLSLSSKAADVATADNTERMMAKGVNFASGGSGLLSGTGQPMCGEVLSMAEQVGNFTSLVQMMENIDRRKYARLIAKSLVFITVGSNDLFEYAGGVAANRSAPGRNDIEFLQGLVGNYTAYVKDLYAAGASKFSVVSPSLVGCCPSQLKIARAVNDTDPFGCFGLANNLSGQLYPMIAAMLDGLSRELPGIKYSLADSIQMAVNFVISHGNITRDHACCGSGAFGGDSVCNSTVPLCPDRSKYLFWDWFHPTDAVSDITAHQLFVDNGTFVHPINVHQLVAH